MKQFLRPLALAAATLAAAGAQAQSSVSLYGLVDVGVGQFEANQVENGSGGSFYTLPWTKKVKVEPGMMSTSYWGLSGKEDLGGGVAAEFKLEAFFLGDTGAQGRFGGDTNFARSAYVGLTSKELGTVRMGRNTPPLFISTLIFNPFGDSFVWSPSIRQWYNGSAGSQLRGDSGWNNSVNYISPSLGGLTINGIVSAGEGWSTTTTGTGKNYGLTALYFGGPFAATLSWQSVEQGNTGGDTQDSWQFGGSYNAGFAKFFAQFGQIDDSDISGVKDDLWSVSASVPLAGGAILASYAETKFKGTGTGKRTTGTVGYNYPMSKRTDITFAAMTEEVDAGSVAIDFAGFKPVGGAIGPALGNDGVSYGINIRHKF